MLQKYSHVLSAVEINSSFYRDHKPQTYVKWAATVPSDFKFSVKLAKRFTHENRLRSTEGLTEVLEQYRGLGANWGALLVQLPPSLAFEHDVSRKFWKALRKDYTGPVAFEPRHRTWVELDAKALLHEFAIARVVADPDPLPTDGAEARNSGAAPELQYYRLHGSPVIYKSEYELCGLRQWRARLEAEPAREVWCIFDNTTFGHATTNALWLQDNWGESCDKSVA